MPSSQRPAAEALVRAHRNLKKEGYGLLVFDGYRPWAVTKVFWDLTPEDKKDFVADPRKGSKHNRGCAVDLSLYDLKTGREVEMPGAYDEMSERSYPTPPAGSAEARSRRDLLARGDGARGVLRLPVGMVALRLQGLDGVPDPRRSVRQDRCRRIEAAQPPKVPDLASARIVDLTHPFDEHTLYWPTSALSFDLKVVSRGKTEGGISTPRTPSAPPSTVARTWTRLSISPRTGGPPTRFL